MYCTLCNTYHNNPKQLQGHLKSSCHERAIQTHIQQKMREQRRDILWTACQRMRALDPWHISWQQQMNAIHDEFQSKWPIFEQVEKYFKCARKRHASQMWTWWGVILYRLPIHCVGNEIIKWLAPYAVTNWSDPRAHYSRNGNLNLKNFISPGDFQQSQRHIFYPAITFPSTMQTFLKPFNRCVSPMDLD